MITNIKLKIQLLLFASFFCLGFLASAQAQSYTPSFVMDSSCNLTISLLDSSSTIVSNNPPYLFSIIGTGINTNSNSLATTTVDLSNVVDTFYTITIMDGSQNVFMGTYTVNCGLSNTNGTALVFTDSINDATTCSTCDGSGGVVIQNPNGGLYTFAWGDGITTTHPSFGYRSNLCPGAYTVVVTNLNNQSSSTIINIGCNNSIPPAVATCIQPSLQLYLGSGSSNNLVPQDLSTQTLNLLPQTQAYLIDDLGNIQNSVTFNCNDLGYHVYTLLFVDAVLQTSDTCHSIVQVIDSSGICNGQSNANIIINSSTTDPSNCSACTGLWTGLNLVDTLNNTLISGSFTYLWNDGSNVGPTRQQLCANQLYSVTMTDTSSGNSYSESFILGCLNSQFCVDTSIIDDNIPCTQAYAPVCGCDGQTYINACIAQYEHGLTAWVPNACSVNDLTISITTNPATCDSNNISCNGSALSTVYGGSGNYTYVWGPTITSTTADAFNLCNGYYTLTVSDSFGNVSVASVFVGLSNCVWPGDTDDNTVANNFDLLPIALNYEDSGTIRPNQDILWYAHQTPDWQNNSLLGLPNHKHFDCDGNGLIDSTDITAILQNYGESYFRASTTSKSGPAPFMIQNAVGSPSDSLIVPILLGSQAFPIANAYAVAFTINYDPSIIEANSIAANFNASWLGSDLIEIQKDFYSSGKIELAVGRIDKLPITSGFGQLGTLSFTIKDDVWIGRTIPADSTITSPFTISAIRLIDQYNTEIGTTPRTGTVVISPNTSINKINNELDIRLFPNPTRDILHIKSGTAKIQAIRLFTATGQLVQERTAVTNHTESISTNNLPNGIYFISIQTNKGIYNNRLQVLH